MSELNDTPRKPIITIKRRPPMIAMPRKTAVTMQLGDVATVLKDLDANSFDAALTDPPYGLTTIVNRYGKTAPPTNGERPNGRFGRLARGFMGKTWDRDVPSIDALAELLRVVKPGATLLAFGHPRTYHRLACRAEKAGWVIVDRIAWHFLTGFPKSRDLSNDIEQVADDDSAASEAMRWRGYGTALKPAYEDILVAMKPRDGSFAANALKWGVAGLNLDACRIPCTDKTPFPIGRYHSDRGMFGSPDRLPDSSAHARYPTNVIIDEGVARLLDEQWPGISRFFYCAKATAAERHEGLEGFQNKQAHPTMKPLDLCRYLATLILPPQRDTPRKLIVPYAGVGAEIIGALMAGWDDVLGIEIDPDYHAMGSARIAHWRTRLALD